MVTGKLCGLQEQNCPLNQETVNAILAEVQYIESPEIAKAICGIVWCEVTKTKIPAVKALRQRLGIRTKEAKEIVDNWRALFGQHCVRDNDI